MSNRAGALVRRWRLGRRACSPQMNPNGTSGVAEAPLGPGRALHTMRRTEGSPLLCVEVIRTTQEPQKEQRIISGSGQEPSPRAPARTRLMQVGLSRSRSPPGPAEKWFALCSGVPPHEVRLFRVTHLYQSSGRSPVSRPWTRWGGGATRGGGRSGRPRNRQDWRFIEMKGK